MPTESDAEKVIRKVAAAEAVSKGVTEREGFIIEAAFELGFEMLGDDGEVYVCTQAELLAFAEMVRKATKEHPDA